MRYKFVPSLVIVSVILLSLTYNDDYLSRNLDESIVLHYREEIDGFVE